MSEKIKCEFCGELFDVSEMRENPSSGNYICNECAEKHYVICGFCGKLCEDDYDYVVHMDCGDVICQDCFADYGFTCYDCGGAYYNSDGHAVDEGGEYVVCDSCFRNYTRCHICGEYRRYPRTIEDCRGQNIDICEWCYENNEDIHQCQQCGDYYYDPDGVLGDCCHAHSYYAPSGRIHSYGYKPVPEFYPCAKEDTVYMGVELEVDGIFGKSRSQRKAVGAVYESMGNHVYLKHDGSLDSDGFEIVSHPCTMEYHLGELSEKWKATMQSCIDNGFYSHDAKTCGLHVHVSLRPLEKKDPGIVGKLLYIVDRYWDNIVNFSRRTQSQLSTYAQRYSCKAPVNRTTSITEKTKAKGSRNRFFAINLQNEHTIEFRVFRGTVNYETFAATLQFIQVLLDKLTSISYRKLQTISWAELTYSEYQELNEYLKKRNLYQEFILSDDEEEQEEESEPEETYYLMNRDVGYYPFDDDEDHPCRIVETYRNHYMVAFDEAHENLHRGDGSTGENNCYYVHYSHLLPMQ